MSQDNQEEPAKEDTPNQEKPVKENVPNQVLIGAILIIRTIVMTQVYNYYFPSIKRTINVVSEPDFNLLTFEADNDVSFKSFLKKDTTTLLKSYFRPKISIQNTGYEAIIDFIFVIDTNDGKIVMSDNPKITSNPDKIIKGIKIIKETSESTKSKHIWVIDLLNPNQEVTFEYACYPLSKYPNIKLEGLVKKENRQTNDIIDSPFANFKRSSQNISFWLSIALTLFSILNIYAYYRSKKLTDLMMFLLSMLISIVFIVFYIASLYEKEF
jgi:hypothetical protein